MLKKISIVTALSTVLFFGGAFSPAAEISAQDHSHSKIYYSVSGNWGGFSESDLQNLLDKFFNHTPLEQEEQTSDQTKLDKTPVKEDEQVQLPEKEPKNEEDVDKSEQKQEQPEEVPVTEEPKKEQPTPNTEEDSTQAKEKQDVSQSEQLSQFEQQVVSLTNEERAKQGLPALEVDSALSKVAREKSQDMAANGYFDHTSPTYGSPFDMMQQYGISYRTAGENIAKGQRTPEEVVNGWMNSEGHRANILNQNFTHIGVGYVEQGNYWTQQFIGK